MPQPPLANIERHKLILTENVKKLETASKYWQDWEIEYLGLVEELEDGDEGEVTTKKLASIAQDISSKLLNEREISGLLSHPRPASEVVAILLRRIDYVRQNQKSIQKQLENARKQLESAGDVIKDAQNEEGLPLMEIVEELDEDGNMISGLTAVAADKASELVQTLQKAGVLDKPITGPDNSDELQSKLPAAQKEPQKEQEKLAEISDSSHTTNVEGNKVEGVESSVSEASIKKKKGQEDEVSDFDRFLKSPEGAKFIVVDDYDNIISRPIVPKNEPEDEARLRKEMLDYNSISDSERGIEEMQSIVAEIDLEDDDNEMEISDDELTEDEDEHIRPRGSMLDPAYIAEMQALDRRLNGVQDTFQKGEHAAPTKEILPAETPALKTRRPSDQEKESKKGVRFAEELDIAPDPTKLPMVRESDKERPIHDQVLERTFTRSSTIEPITDQPVGSSAGTSATEPTKISKFKAQRQAMTPSRQRMGPDMSSLSLFPASKPPLPVGKKNSGLPKVLAGSVVERAQEMANVDTDNYQPPSLSDYDEALHRQEVANEYHKQRNKRIHAQGGFLADKDEEDEIQPLDNAPKPSRFMATRLKRLDGEQ